MGDRNGWPGFHMYQCIATRIVPTEDYEKVLHFANKDVSMADYPGFAEAFQVMKEMQTKGVWGDGVLAMDDLEAQSVFLNGQGAMYETGTWAISTLREGLGDDLDFFLFPAIKDEIGKVLTVSYADEFIVSAYKDEVIQDTVADFYNMVLSPNGQEYVAETGAMPIRTDLRADDLADNPKVDPITIGVVKEFSSGDYPTTDEIVTFWGAELYAELRSVVQEVIGGTITPEQAVERLDSLAGKIRQDKE
jgi:raffinose/stachyose/melibiose transport system substrate-binding protein